MKQAVASGVAERSSQEIANAYRLLVRAAGPTLLNMEPLLEAAT